MTVSLDPAHVHAPPGAHVPDFFIVGHAKSGTTALYEMLRQHPQIYMPDHKEPWFFARSNPHPQTNGERSIAFTGKRMETMEDYLALFRDANPNQLVGEASTSYLWSTTAASRIAEVRPDARIIAIFREPASFLRSLHLQLLTNRHETEKDLRKAIALDDARREDRHIPKYSYWPRALIYSDRVRYAEQLRRYHAVFPREQVMVLIYDDFRQDNAGTVRDVVRFLGVEGTQRLDVLEANPTITVRSVRLHSLIRVLVAGRGPVSGALKSAIKALTPASLREEFVHPMHRRLIYRYPEPPNEEVMLELRRRFKGEVVALSEYLDRDLVSLWGYDSIG